LSTQNDNQEETKRGRPLDLSRNKVILTATLDLLAENGFDALTIDAVAARAKVGKATIYRRWSSKTDLVIDAAAFMSPFEKLEEYLDRNQPLRGQLIDMLSFIFQCDDDKAQNTLTAIYTAAASNEKLDKVLKNEFYWRHREAMASIIRPFLEEQHQLIEAEFDLLSDIGPALITYRGIFVEKPFDRAYVERMVDMLMIPMINTLLSEDDESTSAINDTL